DNGSATGTVTVTITGVNDAPVVDLNGAAAGQNYITTAFTTATTSGVNVVDSTAATFTDVDQGELFVSAEVKITNAKAGDLLTWSAGAVPGGVTVTYNGTDTLTISGAA